jgi:DNA-binding IscR family transcriptional regulator
MIARTTLHAIRALAALAGNAPGEYAGAAAIAERIKAPRNYLGKLLQSLARAGLVQGQKGRWNGCFLGQSSCRADRPCAMHNRWTKVREVYVQFLKQTSVLDVVNQRTEI